MATEKDGNGAGATGYGAAALGRETTIALARFIAGIRYEQLPPAAVHEARRAVVDWLGCAIAGSTHPTVAILIETLEDLGSKPVATLIAQGGRKLGLQDAPIANGQMGHILDFDDTHLSGVILHTSTAVLPALLALGEHRRTSGRDLIVALAAGFEAGIRAGRAAPGHHRGGWHLTGTLGSIAAAAAAGRLIGLDPRQMTHALGIACTQAAGMQQNRGTDCKSFHAGKAAYHGVLSAMLASKGFDSSSEILEGRIGFMTVYSAEQRNDLILPALGEDWLITGNGYKPYACGVVLHPLIDAVIAVSKQIQAPPADVAELRVRVHPDVIRITGVDNPGSGLMTKFSANHAAAVAFADRTAGIAQFTAERAGDVDLQTLRRRVAVEPVASYRLDEAEAEVTTRAGARHLAHVDHATGTTANPMSDAALSGKFQGNAAPVLGAARAQQILDLAWRLDGLDDVGDLVRACA